MTMVKENQLYESRCYFFLSRPDRWSPVPLIETFIYVGKDLRDSDKNIWYFQDARSYVEKGPFVDLSDRSGCLTVGIADELPGGIFTLHGLVSDLQRMKNEDKNMEVFGHINDNNCDKFIHGICYFEMFYCVPQLYIPEIKTYIFVGKNLYPDDEQSRASSWYFQDPKSYLLNGPFTAMEDSSRGDIVQVNRERLSIMYSLDGVISELQRIEKKVGKEGPLA